MDSKVFGRQIRNIRKKQGVSPEQLAEVLDVNAGTIGQIESGRRLTTIGNLVKMCNYFKISPEYFLLLELEEKFDNDDSDYKKLCYRLLELRSGEFNQIYDFIELMLKNRERYK
jgi:transcriptional regulator with XRE-family HTH domain